MAEEGLVTSMFEAFETQIREKVTKEITAFCSEHHHHKDGRDVVIVEQLLNFLAPVKK